MDIWSLALFSFTLALMAGSPGPSIAALVARVLARGWRDVMPFLAAMWVGEVVWVALALSGLATLAESFQTAFLVIKYIGVAYLLYLAWCMWHAPLTGESAEVPEKSSAWGMFGAGLAVTFGNPKILVFYAALLPSLVDITQASISMWAVLSLVAVATLAVVDMIWVALAHGARSFLKSPRAMRVSNRVGATTMGGAAALIATP